MGSEYSSDRCSGDPGYFECPEGVSRERADRVLPHRGSEDASRVLQLPQLSQREPLARDRDFLPDPLVEWIVHADFAGDPAFSREQLLNVLSKKCEMHCGNPELFGYSPENGHWTYVRAAGVPETYTKLKFSWHLCSPLAEPRVPVTAELLSKYANLVLARCRTLGNATLTLAVSPEDGEKQAKKLHELVESCDREVMVVLRADSGQAFDGRDIWDVMLCLGLRWGDMDLFHWRNGAMAGDDSFFRVWTSTEPGYFLPEHIAMGQVHTEDLVFGFSLPRCAAPVAVFAEMVKAARYAQRRLGGALLDASGELLDESETIAEIDAIAERLSRAGYAPGSDAVLRLF